MPEIYQKQGNKLVMLAGSAPELAARVAALEAEQRFLQSGGVYPWFDALDYPVGAHVLGSDGQEYVALQPSGPDVSGVGAQDPITAAAYWQLTPDATALASKADINLSNLTATGLAAMAHAAMPSMQTVEYSMPAANTPNVPITIGAAPANGWLRYQCTATATGGIGAGVLPAGGMYITDSAYQANAHMTVLVPVSAGATMFISYAVRPTNNKITFFYANGNV